MSEEAESNQKLLKFLQFENFNMDKMRIDILEGLKNLQKDIKFSKAQLFTEWKSEIPSKFVQLKPIISTIPKSNFFTLVLNFDIRNLDLIQEFQIFSDNLMSLDFDLKQKIISLVENKEILLSLYQSVDVYNSIIDKISCDQNKQFMVQKTILNLESLIIEVIFYFTKFSSLS